MAIKKRKTKVILESQDRLGVSEGKLQAFMDSATEGFVIYDSGLHLCSINSTALGIFPAGSTAENLRGKHILEIVPGLGETGRYDELLKILRTGKPVHFDDIVPESRFGDRSLSIHAFRVGDGLGIIFTDITERKKAVEEITSLSKFPSENPFPVMRISKNKVLLYANAAAQFFLSEDNIKLGEVVPGIWHSLVDDVFACGSVKQDIEIAQRDRIYSWVMVPILDVGYINVYSS